MQRGVTSLLAALVHQGLVTLPIIRQPGSPVSMAPSLLLLAELLLQVPSTLNAFLPSQGEHIAILCTKLRHEHITCETNKFASPVFITPLMLTACSLNAPILDPGGSLDSTEHPMPCTSTAACAGIGQPGCRCRQAAQPHGESHAIGQAAADGEHCHPGGSYNKEYNQLMLCTADSKRARK